MDVCNSPNRQRICIQILLTNSQLLCAQQCCKSQPIMSTFNPSNNAGLRQAMHSLRLHMRKLCPIIKEQIIGTRKSTLRKSPDTGTHCWNPRSRQATLACVMPQLSLHMNIFLSWSTSFTSTIPSESPLPYFKEMLNCPKIKPKECETFRH